jgi:hypothetical protein
MDALNLKSDIINRIQNSEDKDLLMDIARLIKVDDDYTKITFTKEQKSTIQKSIADYTEGNFLTDKVAENDIQKWLKD